MALTSKVSQDVQGPGSGTDRFSHISLCESCKTKSCCTDFAEPILFPIDIARLQSLSKTNSDFIQETKIKDRHVKTLRRKPGSRSCIFLNEKENSCAIYENRPFDCRMFPFDIVCFKDDYYWIIYTCNPESDWRWTEEHLKKLEADPQFSEVMSQKEVFQLVSTNFISTKAPTYALLRRIGVKDGAIS